MRWESYIASLEDSAYLESLTVTKTQDEFNKDRYFVTDYDGNWIGEAHDTADSAFNEIDKMRTES